jgi:hypothetical protein
MTANFFDNIDPDEALELERLSKLIYELREHRGAILSAYGVADEIALLERIYTGTLAEHPAYEHYLAARILTETRETVRAMIADCMKEVVPK